MCDYIWKEAVIQNAQQAPIIPDVSRNTLIDYMCAEKSEIYLRLVGLSETHIKFEVTLYYPIDRKYRMMSSMSRDCHEYKVTALIPLIEWIGVVNTKGSLDGFVNYVWPRTVKEYIRLAFVRTH